MTEPPLHSAQAAQRPNSFLRGVGPCKNKVASSCCITVTSTRQSALGQATGCQAVIYPLAKFKQQPGQCPQLGVERTQCGRRLWAVHDPNRSSTTSIRGADP